MKDFFVVYEDVRRFQPDSYNRPTLLNKFSL